MRRSQKDRIRRFGHQNTLRKVKKSKHVKHLEKLAEKEGISYTDAIKKFYKVKTLQAIPQNIRYSLFKRRNKGIDRKAEQAEFKKLRPEKKPKKPKKEVVVEKKRRRRKDLDVQEVGRYICDMKEAAEVLEKLRAEDVFVSCAPDVLDFTNVKKDAQIIVQGGGVKAKLPLVDFKDIEHLSAALPAYLTDGLLICWDIKEINTYLLGRTENPVAWNRTPYDLKVIEHYFGINEKRPERSIDSQRRLVEIVKSMRWKKFKPYYDQVYVPLMTDVIPTLETTCLTDRKARECVYAHYEIEGQLNGRLKCSKAYKHGFNPHSMSFEFRANLAPTSHDQLFFYFDYKHMEVSVLAWLSQDPVLLDILKTGEDLYEAIWKAITGIKPTEKHRSICKNLFLPVIYGQGKKSLAIKLGIDEKIANGLIDKIYNTFQKSIQFVKSHYTDAHGFATDAFGRKRKFSDEESYKIRNFCIQSPAAMICNTKLVRIHQKLKDLCKLAYYQHDGFCILINAQNWKLAYDCVKEELEREDELFEGLILKTSCAGGRDLNSLKNIMK